MSYKLISFTQIVAAACLAVLISAAEPVMAQSKGDAGNRDIARELERAREKVEEAREELREATRELARSMARVEKNTPRGQYLNFIANPRRAVLGLIINHEQGDGVANAVKVLAVTPGSGAERAGLKSGDLITAINGTPLTGDDKRDPQRKMQEALHKLTAGDEVQLDYERDGKRATANVVTQAPEPDLAMSLAPMPHWAEGMHDLPDPDSFAPLASMFHYRGPAIRGLELVKLDADLGHYFKTTDGVLVVKAPKSGAVALRSGDVIQMIDGSSVTEPVAVLDMLRSRGAVQDVKLTVLRQGRVVEIDGKIPAVGADSRRGDRRKHKHVAITNPNDNGEEDVR